MARPKPDREAFVDHLLATYGRLSREWEPSASFVAEVWARIDERRARGKPWIGCLAEWYPRLAVGALTLIAVMVVANWMQFGSAGDSAVIASTYVEALELDSMGDHDRPLWVLAENGR